MALTPGGPAGFCPQPWGKSSPEILGPQDLLPKMAPALQTRSRCGPCPSPRPERPRGGSYPPQSNARRPSIHPDGASAVGRALGRLHHLTDGPPQPPRGGVLLGPSPRWEALSGLAKATRWARPARSKPVAQTPSPRPTGPGRREGHTHSAWRPPALPTPLSNPCPSGKPEARTWLRSGASRGSRPETLSGNRSREVKRSRPLFGRPVGATGCVMANCSARQSYPPRGPLT